MSTGAIRSWREKWRAQATLFQNVSWERESNDRTGGRKGWVGCLSSGDVITQGEKPNLSGADWSKETGKQCAQANSFPEFSTLTDISVVRPEQGQRKDRS